MNENIFKICANRWHKQTNEKKKHQKNIFKSFECKWHFCENSNSIVHDFIVSLTLANARSRARFFTLFISFLFLCASLQIIAFIFASNSMFIFRFLSKNLHTNKYKINFHTFFVVFSSIYRLHFFVLHSFERVFCSFRCDLYLPLVEVIAFSQKIDPFSSQAAIHR